MESGHRWVDHTADISVELWAFSEEELLREGSRALIEELTEGAQVQGTSSRTVKLEAVDREDRLVQFMNEVLWLALSEGFLVADADITLAGTDLEATLHGESNAHEKLRGELKSVTYHDLRLVKETDGRYVARLVIDV